MRYVFPLLVVVLSGCGGGEGNSGPSGPQVSLTAVNDTIRPGEVILLAGSGLAPFAATVSAQLGGTALTLMRVNDSTLAGLVPAVGVGQADLTVTLSDTTAAVRVTMLAALTFADPTNTIVDLFDAQLALFPDSAPAGEDSAAWGAESALLDSLVADAKATLADLTPAERLALARLLSAFTAGAPPPATAPSLLGEPACTATEYAVLEATYHGSVGVATSLAASVVGLFSERLKKTLDVAAVNKMREMRILFNSRNAQCRVPKQVRYTSLGVRGAPALSSSLAEGPDRFFKGYRMRYMPGGDFRSVSAEELPKNALLATVDAAYGKVRALVVGNAAKFPTWAQPIIGALPPSIAQTAPGALRSESMAPSQVRIEGVSPASVSLSVGALGDELTLTSSNNVTVDVPFTYSLVSVTDPGVRKTMSGVLRPFMAATFGASAGVVQGDRSIVNVGGFDYGKLTCGGTRMLRVTGGDKGVWQEFQWVQTLVGQVADSMAEPLGATEFEAGDHPFQGSWYSYWRENDSPVYKSFTVGLRVSYIDQVTDSLKYSSEFWFTCQ